MVQMKNFYQIVQMFLIKEKDTDHIQHNINHYNKIMIKVYTVDNSNAFLTVPQCNSSFNVPTGTQCIGGDIKQGPRNRAVNPQLNGGGMLAYSGVGVKTW
jgi:hypothetical protein